MITSIHFLTEDSQLTKKRGTFILLKKRAGSRPPGTPLSRAPAVVYSGQSPLFQKYRKNFHLYDMQQHIATFENPSKAQSKVLVQEIAICNVVGRNRIYHATKR